MCHYIMDALPIVTIFLIMLWTTYAYIFEMCVMMIGNMFQQIIYIVVYLVLFFLTVFMYIFLLCKKHFEFPDKFFIPSDTMTQLKNVTSFKDEYNLLLAVCRARDIKVFTRNDTGQIRYCRDCGIIKPDRTHHCTKCDTCIMKMDHHCPWINNCVGYANHKYFVQLTFIAAVLCTFTTITSIEFVYYFFRRFQKRRLIGKLNVVILPLITGGIGIALWVLFFFHLHLICKNMTTLESMYPPTFTGPIESTFDQGRKGNCREEWSSNCCSWWCPTDSMEGNGVDFDVIEYTEE